MQVIHLVSLSGHKQSSIGHNVFCIPYQVNCVNTFFEHVCNASLIVSNIIDSWESSYVFFLSASNKRYKFLKNYMADNSLQFRNVFKTKWISWTVSSIKAAWLSSEAIYLVVYKIKHLIEIPEEKHLVKKKFYSLDFR